jgi:hypothetical protein
MQRKSVTRELPGEIHYSVFSDDGTRLALAMSDGTLRLIDVSSGKELRHWQVPTVTVTRRRNDKPYQYQGLGITCPHFSPDGSRLYALTDGHIHRWETQTGKELAPIKLPERNWGADVLYIPSLDAKMLLVSHQDTNREAGLSILAEDTGRVIRTFDLGMDLARIFAFSGDGRTAVVAGLENRIRVIDLTSGQRRAEIGTWTYALALSSNGQYLATAREEVVEVWHMGTGRRVRYFTGQYGFILSLAFSPDGSRLASSGDDNGVVVWDTSGLRAEMVRDKPRLEASELQDLWTGLTDADAERAYRAVSILALYPSQAAPFLKEQLKPIPAAETERMAGLIKRLDHDEFEQREIASAELATLGRRALPMLRLALEKKPSAEARRRLDELVEKLRTEHGLPPSEETIRLRVIEALEGGGTAESGQLLEVLARGRADATASREAKAALERLRRRGALPAQK